MKKKEREKNRIVNKLVSDNFHEEKRNYILIEYARLLLK